MGILFKTYNGKHQLHLYNELWCFPSRNELDTILVFFSPKELKKIKIKPNRSSIDVEFNGVIVDCDDLNDLKHKFGLLVEMKNKYQKTTPKT